MSYAPPPHNGQYQSQFVQQPSQQLQRPPQFQPGVSADPQSFQYGKPFVYSPVTMQTFPAYAQAAYNPQQQQQQQPHYPLQQQYAAMNTFPQVPPPTPPLVHGPPQYTKKPAASVTSYAAPNNTQNHYSPISQPPLPTPLPSSIPAQSTPTRTPSVAHTPPSLPHGIPQALGSTPTPNTRRPLQQQDPKKQKPKPKPKSQRQPSQSMRAPVDYQVLLLSLADEYLNTAHDQGTTVALSSQEADVEEYYKLVATGLGCLEAVLKVGGSLRIISQCTCLLRPSRTGDYNPGWKHLSACDTRVPCSRRRIMTWRQKLR